MTMREQGYRAYMRAVRNGGNLEGVFLGSTAVLSVVDAAEYERGWVEAADEQEEM